MSVYAKVFVARVGPIQHNIVGTQELALGHDLEAKTEHVAAVDGIWVWIVDLEGGDGAADAIETLLDVGALLFRFGQDLGARGIGGPGSRQGGWLEN